MEKKFLLIIALVTAVVLSGGVFLFSNSGGSAARIEKTLGAQIQIPHKNFDFKDIKYNGGNVTHAFPIKNNGSKELVLANLSTSCMCTQVYLKKGDEKSPSFGMKGHSAASDWKGVLMPKEEAEVIVVFDPTAHGPQGIGPVERFVSAETNDPENPYVEFAFNGVVVK